jgi:DMSO reductase family type II enzyme chaperone
MTGVIPKLMESTPPWDIEETRMARRTGMAAAIGESIQGLVGQEQEFAAARSRTYALFNEAIAYPDDEFCETLRQGGLVIPLRESLTTLSPRFELPEARWQALQDVGSTEDLAVEHTRLFDVGASGPPCPLYAGLYGGDRMKKMEEAVRFYNLFGLTLSDEQRELPDHIATQLEFMHYLAYREVEALHADLDPGSYRRAQRDFVERQLGGWVPKLSERLEGEKAGPYIRTLVSFLCEFLAWEGDHLAS